MTLRQNFLENQRKVIHVVVALCVMLMAVLLMAGCVDHIGIKNKTGNVTPNSIPISYPTIKEQPSQKPTTILTSDDYWINVDPIVTARKNNITVSGTTNLPESEMLEIHISTTVVFSKPYGYDHSHESAADETPVRWINTTTRGFSAVIDVSKLNPGKYAPQVQSQRNLSVYSNGLEFDLLPAPSPTTLNRTDYIYSNCPSLPPLYVNGSMEPVLIAGGVTLVPPDSKTQSNQISYGAIMLFSADGIDRIFNENGSQIAAIYDSNELHLWQIPGGARVNESGNITTLYLDKEKILTKIYEEKPCA